MKNKTIKKTKWTCSKCECKNFSKSELRATGGLISQIFDIQNKKFLTLSCDDCGHTELYKKTNSKGNAVLDFLIR